MQQQQHIPQQEIERANPYVLSFLKLRRMVGFVAFLIAPVLFLITFFGGDCKLIQDSISHYYYTIAGDVFVGMLCATSFFLIVYPGYEKNDNLLTNAAGLFALGIAFFPTSPMLDRSCTVVTMETGAWSSSLHGIFAALFFGTLAYIAIKVFTKSKDHPAIQATDKKRRNRIYKTCGFIMLGCIAVIGAYFLVESLGPFYARYNLVYWFEFIALIAFAICWLVKGEALKSVPVVEKMLY